ncbi:MAG: hypothetical protein ACI4XA_08505 [Oscillospiraceae bacterium]
MKKIIALSVFLSALALAVTGCSNNANSSSSGNSSTGSEATSSVTSASEATSETSNTSETSPAGTSDTSETNDTSEAPSAATRAGQYAEAASGAAEWPAMMEVTDPEEAMLQFSIDTALCEDYYLSCNLMSVHFNRILIAKPAAGSEEALKEQFDSYWSYLAGMEKEGLYEAQAVSLSGMVRGETSDGYYYIIVNQDGAAAEDAMLAL